MRTQFSKSIEKIANNDRLVFLTGDLGFNALEDVQKILGERFINAGVAEQNMIGVAAALAKEGFNTWAYSISPFLYARAFEQIRNDICFHNLPVHLVGNGGGYGYGVMGPTHHALEDYGTLLTLNSHCDFRVFVPAFSEDVTPIVDEINGSSYPSYLRLGRCEKPANLAIPEYSQWRKVLNGELGVIIVVGPLAGNLLADINKLTDSERPSVWILAMLPILLENLPAELIADIKNTAHLAFVEEHGAYGGAGGNFLQILYKTDLKPSYSHHHAKGYPSGRYGSQNFHRKESGLNFQTIIESFKA